MPQTLNKKCLYKKVLKEWCSGTFSNQECWVLRPTYFFEHPFFLCVSLVDKAKKPTSKSTGPAITSQKSGVLQSKKSGVLKDCLKNHQHLKRNGPKLL